MSVRDSASSALVRVGEVVSSHRAAEKSATEKSATEKSATENSATEEVPVAEADRQQAPPRPVATEAHAAQNRPTIQQHVEVVRSGQGIPPEQLAGFARCHE